VKVTGKKKNVVINGILEAFLKAYPQKGPVLTTIDNMAMKTKPKNEVVQNTMYDDEDEEEDDDDDDEEEEEVI
jgi:hypothetical protein